MNCRRSLTIACFAASACWLVETANLTGQEFPRLTDERLELTLFAESSDIVTPVGMVIDAKNRIFVIESHTHQPPADYVGPNSDRVLLFIDQDDDGKPDKRLVFAEGIHQAMNLALSPDGQLYVVCAREVLRLIDVDHDNVCDRQEKVLELITRERYAHNSLLGITFDREGWMYVSRGNTGSNHYRFKGADDSSVEGFGDGGSVVRCRSDGTQLAEFATGFWNPFDLKFDRNGRLLLVDNDPDARGPNRLLHVVLGGDYGYKSLYGGSGNHAFQGWDGSLPGTLPYIAGTGEAPSGLVDCRRSSLPTDYQSSVLATIWNENSIERFELRESKGTLKLHAKSIFLKGGKNFRPVAIDCDGRGNLFVTDWVLVDYPNHGRGRIWRISTKAKAERLDPQPYFATYEEDSTRELRSRFSGANDVDILVEGLSDSDPYIRHAAQRRLTNPNLRELRNRLSVHKDPRVRLGVLLATKSSGVSHEFLIRKFLSDPNVSIRQAALMWAGQTMDRQLRPALDAALMVQPVTATIFETYLAAVENLEAEFIEAFAARATRANRIPRRLDADVVVKVAESDSFSIEVRKLAVQNFDDETTELRKTWLLEQVAQSDDVLAIASMRRLAALQKDGDGNLARALKNVALDDKRSVTVRCEALLWLGPSQTADWQSFLPLLGNQDADIAIEAARTFRAWLDAGHAIDGARTIQEMSLSEEVKRQLAYAANATLFGKDAIETRPQSNQQWHDALLSGGNPTRGRRVFSTDRVGCAKCHTMDGRGAVLGPDLSHVAQSKSRVQILDAILDPSAEFPPQYQAWAVVTTDGRTHRGLQLDHKSGGAIVLTTESGENVYFKGDEVEDYAALPTSLMPSGLPETMSVDEFRDLVAFLSSLK